MTTPNTTTTQPAPGNGAPAAGSAVVTAKEPTIADLDAKLEKLSKGLEARRPVYPPGGNPYLAFGAPNVREGEDPLTSRGYSFMKMLGVITGQIDHDKAKVEMEVHEKLHNAYVKGMGNAGYIYKGSGNKFLAPLATSFMHEDMVPRQLAREFKHLVQAGTEGADLDEMNWIHRKSYAQYGRKDLSWLNENLGGALVAPPEQGELIQLLRNREALVNAGARVVPLPPQGRLVYPRQTSASLTYWVGENKAITASDIGTGEVTLQGKKLAVLIKMPNELVRFASPAAEALVRDDMTRSLALGADLAGLEGLGGDNRPLGIIQRENINRINSSKPGGNGDALVPEDIYLFPRAVEEVNAEFEGFVMRPKTLYEYYRLRADAVAQGDKQGVFVFNLIREAGAGVAAMLGGYPVTKSTQVSRTRTKTGGDGVTPCTYIVGGMWSDLLIGMFGAIEFAQTAVGDSAFINDQTWVRGILTMDTAPRHEAGFVLMDNLLIP